MPHLDRRRIGIAAADVRDVRQAQLVARGAADRHGSEIFDCIELARHAHLHHVQRGLHRAGRFDGILLAQLRQHRIHVQSELRQALLGDFDVELFVLHAKQLDLGHVGHAQQLLAHVVGKGLELGIAETVRLECVDHAVHVAELVVEERPDHALGQRALHVADLLAHRVPDVGHVGRLAGVLDLENDLRLARLGIAADLVRKRCLLQRALQFVGHLLGHLLRGGARPVGAHHHGTESERRILVLTELEVGGHAQQHQDDHQEARERIMLQRPARDVEGFFGVCVPHERLTGWPGHWTRLPAPMPASGQRVPPAQKLPIS
jgi:hypothetical protein